MNPEIQIDLEKLLERLKKDNEVPLIGNDIISNSIIKSFSVNFENKTITVNSSDLKDEEFILIKYLLLKNNKL